jgi:hypothetical protein
MSDKRILGTSILFFLMFCIAIIFMGSRIIVYPVKDSEKKKQEPNIKLTSEYIAPHLREDELGAIEIQREMAEGADKNEELDKKYKMIPRFHKPNSNIITREDVERTHYVWTNCVGEWKEFRGTHLKQPPRFFKVLALYAYLPAMLHVCWRESLVDLQMRHEEFNWIMERVQEAALFCVNRKWNHQSISSEELPHLKRTRRGLCRNLKLEEEIDNELVFYPERLDITKIPRCNVELFLEMKDQVRWVHIDFRQISFDEEDIMRAAQELPPCTP